MIRIGTRLAASAAALAFGGAGIIAAQMPASAATFTQTFSCSVPIVGTETVTADATLTASPNPTAAGSAVSFDLNVASLSLTSPLAINSWSASAEIDGSGAETSAFDATGSGGAIAAGSPVTNADLTGSWTPSVDGTDTFVAGTLTINANVFLLGNVTVSCTPTGTQATAETLTVSG
jgi:hypothetical protein